MKNKKVLSLLLLVAVLLTSVIGAQAEEAPTKLRILYTTAYTFPEGEDENSNGYIAAIEAATNTDIEVVYVPSSDLVNKVTTIIASGEKYDMLVLPGNSANGLNAMSRLITEGAVQPLNAAIEKVAPEIFNMLPEAALPSLSSGGQIYALPSYSLPGSQVLYIRQDWLDNLKLEMPTTLEEALNVIRAFKEQDPDQDGQDDTIGIVFAKDFNHSGAFMGAFGTQYGIWQEKDGALIYSNVSDEMKAAITWLHELYEEELLDERFTVSATADIREMISIGQCGYAVMGWSETRVSLENAVKNDGAVWEIAPFPVGPNGDSGIAERSMIHSLYFVPTVSENVEKMIEVFYYGATDFQEVLYYGLNGEIRTKNEDGTINLNDEMHKKFQYRSQYLPVVNYARFEFEELGRLNDLGEYWRLLETLEAASSKPINNAFAGLPTEEISKLSSTLSTYELEALTEFVLGDRDMSEWEDWVEEWYDLGGDKLTKLINEWYAAQ